MFGGQFWKQSKAAGESTPPDRVKVSPKRWVTWSMVRIHTRQFLLTFKHD
jgi:hypothetical protein